MGATQLQVLGNQLKITFDDGSVALAYPSISNHFIVRDNNENCTYIRELGNQVQINYQNGDIQIGYRFGDYWILTNTDAGAVTPPPPPPKPNIKDTISVGHHITNPGGTVASGWKWHVDNNGHRGGDDWNYDFQTFRAPANGTVTHFDVAGVGMVVKLVLDHPATRSHPEQAAGFDQNGPMKAIWFQHCSHSVDGHHEQGDIIGTSGDGYGAYAPHLHVHGLTDTGNSAGSTNRCCFWGFTP